MKNKQDNTHNRQIIMHRVASENTQRHGIRSLYKCAFLNCSVLPSVGFAQMSTTATVEHSRGDPEDMRGTSVI